MQIGSGFSTSWPLTFARGRNGDIYGVNGEERGFRWDTVTASVEQLGIRPPAAKPSVSVTAGSGLYDVVGFQVVDPGMGYSTPPTLTLSSSGSQAPVARAKVANGRLTGLALQRYGRGYASPPTVTASAPDGSSGGSGATLTVAASGGVAEVLLTNTGSGYTSEPAVSVSGGGSPTSAAILRAIFRSSTGQLDGVVVVSPGEGYTSAPTISFSGGGGSGAAATAVMSLAVTSVTVTAAGSQYAGTPTIQFSGGGPGGAVAEAVISSTGTVSSVGVLQGGSYQSVPTASVQADSAYQLAAARLEPVMRPGIYGKFWCAVRFVDDTTAANRGPIPSSISEIADVEVSAPAAGLTWNTASAVSGRDARVSKVELWRTTADQALVLYRVATIDPDTTTYADTLSDTALADPTRAGFAALPITLPNGQANARRFNPPPQNKRSIAIFQDRAWYGVDVPGRTFTGGTSAAAAEPNALYFSEADEPESVPETNQIIIQENVKGQDRVTALMPFGGGMVVFQERHCYRLSFVSQPLIDASVTLIGQRGCLNQRCWDTYDGVAYVADSMGMYILDGSNATPLSDAIETFWSDGGIHWASSKWFFVRVDPVTRIVRFHFSASAGFPDRALCFHPVTKAWWVEVYAQTFAAAECMTTGGRQALLTGGQSGEIMAFDTGNADRTAAGTAAAIDCSIRTGSLPMDPKSQDRNIRFLYKPTTADCQLSLALHYNGSSSPRAAAVATNRGTGFVTSAGGAATLNLKLARSPLGDATGYAICRYAGRLDDRSSGTDRHLAVAVSLTRPTTEGVTLYGAAIEGVSP